MGEFQVSTGEAARGSPPGLTSLTCITGKTMVLMFPVSLRGQEEISYRHPDREGTLVWRDTLRGNASTLISLNYSELKETRSLYLQTHRSEVRFQSVSVAIPSVAHSCTLFLSKHKMLKANSSKWLQFSQESEGRLRLAGQRCQSSGCFVTRLPGVIFAGGPGKSLTDHLPALHRCFGGHYVCHLILTVAPSPRFQKVNYGSE